MFKNKKINKLEQDINQLNNLIVGIGKDNSGMASYVINMEEKLRNDINMLINIQKVTTDNLEKLIVLEKDKLVFINDYIKSMDVLYENMVTVIKTLIDKGLISGDDIQ